MFQRKHFCCGPITRRTLRLIPSDAKQAGERGLYFWATARESYIGFAYNKNLLPKEAIPKNYDGLLHPALKGTHGL